MNEPNNDTVKELVAKAGVAGGSTAVYAALLGRNVCHQIWWQCDGRPVAHC